MRSLIREFINKDFEDNAYRKYSRYLPKGGLRVNEQDDYIALHSIEVLPEYRNTGIGTSIMTDLTDYADKVGKDIKLVISGTGEEYKRLLKWYQRLGFQRTDDPDGWDMEYMVWDS